MSTDTLLLIGAGGHGLVVLDALERSGKAVGLNILLRDGNPAKAGMSCYGRLVQIPEFPEQALPPGTVFHLALGNPVHRQTLFYSALEKGFRPLTIAHPLASVSAYSHVGEGAFLAAQSVVAPDARLGLSVIVNHGAVVDHEVKIGDFVHIAPNATLGGGVEIGRGSFIGAGAVVLPGCKIGDNCVLGAGAVLTRNLPADSRVAGVPAKALKEKS